MHKLFKLTVALLLAVPLIAKGFRIVDVIDLDFPWHHTPYDTLDKVSARALTIVGEVALLLVREAGAP